MKIKTIWHPSQGEFDRAVNNALAEGYALARRDIVPDHRNLDNTAFYAELVLLDPAPEPEPEAPFNPLDLVRQLREFCENFTKEDCVRGECPLHAICDRMARGKAIDEWEV